jgi:hypothetical protein
VTSLQNLYKYAKTGVASKDMTPFDKLLAMQLTGGGFPVATISGVPPLSFRSDGSALTAWSITGDMKQTGTPTPNAPIIPDECGDYVSDGEHAGEYAVPITVNGITQTVYLTEPLRKWGGYADIINSDGTIARRIVKLVLTGNESYSSYTYATTNGVQISNVLDTIYRRQNGLCTIYPISTQAGTTYCLWIGSGGGDRNLYFISILNTMGLNTADDFKSYVAAQYANNTPVTIWYILATPTTETVTVPTIATAKGSNTLTVDTTLPPYEVSITGHIQATA